MANVVTRWAKSVGVTGARYLGRRLPNAASRRWLFDHVVPALMDPAVLPMGLTERPLKRISVDVPCDPYIYVHRNGYWCGVFFEEELEAYLLRELKPGDTVIDVGANVGHVALPAAALVAPTGRVLAFEPNPELAALVLASAQRQKLPLVMNAFALGEEPGEFTLQMDPAHTGGATLRSVSDPAFSRSVQCAVKRGDVVMPTLTGRVFLKVDVEGFERSTIRGLRGTLRQVDHAVLEVSPEWLGVDGVEELFGLMYEAGFDAFQLRLDGTVGRAVRPEAVTTQVNVLFLRATPARPLS